MNGTPYQRQTIMHQYVKDHPEEFLQEPSKRGINMVEPQVQATPVVEQPVVQTPEPVVPAAPEAPLEDQSRDLSSLSQTELEEIIDNNQDYNAVYMNEPVEGVTMNGVQAGLGDVQVAYQNMVTNQAPAPVAQEAPVQAEGRDISTLSKEELEQILDNNQDYNAVYMNEAVEGITINGVQAGLGDIQVAYQNMLSNNAPATVAPQEPVQDAPAQDAPVQDAPAPTVDAVMQAYSNSGYGVNANGEYFDPNQDEYDANYDPHNDPLFNADLSNESALAGKDFKQLYREYIELNYKMAEILGKEPYPGVENANLFDIAFQLDDNERDLFNEYKDKMIAIEGLDSKVKEQFFEDMTMINTAREQMGAMLGMNPYPGIENEDYHAIGFQLDDNEKEQEKNYTVS